MSGPFDAGGGLAELLGHGCCLPPVVIARRPRNRSGVVGMQAGAGLAAVLMRQCRQWSRRRGPKGCMGWHMDWCIDRCLRRRCTNQARVIRFVGPVATVEFQAKRLAE